MITSQLCILAIDDQRGILAALQAGLEEAGERVITANNGVAGLALAAQEHPDVILLDIRMPGMDGLQVLQALRHKPETERIPVVLLTGQHDLDLLRQGFQLGASDFLRKPFIMDELLPRIRHLALLKRTDEALHLARNELEAQVQERTAELAATVAALRSENTERRRLEEVAQAYSLRLQALSHQLMAAQEAERSRIARELHDEIGQSMTAVRVNIQAALRMPDLLATRHQLQESLRVIDQGICHVRELLVDLRPPLLDDMGLANALQMHVEQQARRAGWQARFDCRLPALPVPAHIELTCFRVVQEALTNAARHARAQQIGVELRQEDGELSLVVWDNGVGFDMSEARGRGALGSHLGLLGIEERVALAGGRLELDSAPGRGTEIRVHLPLAAATAIQAETVLS